MLYRPLSALFCITSFALAVSSVNADVEADTFWKPVRWGKVILAPQATAHETVSIDDVQQLRTKTQLFLTLPDKTSVTAKKLSDATPNDRSFVWYGRVNDEAESFVIFAIVGDTLAGDIVVPPSRVYRVKLVNQTQKVYVVQKIQAFRSAAGANASPQNAQPTSGDTTSCQPAAPTSTIDVMVVYTDLALAAAGGTTDAVKAAVQVAVNETNCSFVNSKIDSQVGITSPATYVGPAMTTSRTVYKESSSLQQDLYTLQGTLNPPGKSLKPVRDLRDCYGADVVVLLTEQTDQRPSDCGLAYQMHRNHGMFERWAFAAIPYDCVHADLYYFEHELGHMMGADHDQVSGGSPPSPYTFNHGHVSVSGQNPWGTMMAENSACPSGCRRIPYWSAHNQSYGGDSLGAPDGTEENAQVLTLTAPTVANYRTSRQCAAPAQ